MLHKVSSPTSLFDHRDMRLVLPARALSFLGDSITFVVMSLAIADGGTPAQMTVLLIAFSLPLFVLAPIAGRIVDEFDSRSVLVVAGSIQVCASVGLVLGDGFAAIVGFVLVLQAGQAVTNTSWQALVPRIVGPQLVGRAIGMQQSVSAAAGLGGAAIGSILFDVIGYHATLLLDTVTFAVLVLVATLVRTRRGRRFDAAGRAGNAPAEAADVDSGSGFSVIRHDALLRYLVPALWLFVLAAEAPNVVEIFLVRDVLGASATAYGVVVAGFMLGQICGPLLAGRIAADPARVRSAALAAAAIGALQIGIGVSASIWAVGLLLFVTGVAAGALNALIGALVVARPPEQVRGRVIAAFSGTARGVSVVALTLGGLGGEMLGPRTTFVICGSMSAIVALLILRARSATETGPMVKPQVPATMEA